MCGHQPNLLHTFLAHEACQTRRPSCHAYVRLLLCSITYISHPRSSQHYAFSSLYGYIWALGIEGRKAGVVVLYSAPVTLIVMHHYTILTAVRCEPCWNAIFETGSTLTDERELIRPWALALLVILIDSKRRYTIPVPLRQNAATIFFWNGLLAHGEERCILNRWWKLGSVPRCHGNATGTGTRTSRFLRCFRDIIYHISCIMARSRRSSFDQTRLLVVLPGPHLIVWCVCVRV